MQFVTNVDSVLSYFYQYAANFAAILIQVIISDIVLWISK